MLKMGLWIPPGEETIFGCGRGWPIVKYED